MSEKIMQKSQNECAYLVQNRLQIINNDHPQKVKDRFTQNFKMRQLLQNINLASQTNKPLLLRGHTEKIICIDQRAKWYQYIQTNDNSLNSSICTSRRLPLINSVSDDDRKNRKQILPPPLVINKSKLAKQGNKGFKETIQSKIQSKVILDQLNSSNKEKMQLYYSTQDAYDNQEHSNKFLNPKTITNQNTPRNIKKKSFYEGKNQLIHQQIPQPPLNSETKLVGREVKMEVYKIEQLRCALKQNLKYNKRTEIQNVDDKSQRPKTKNTKLYDQVYSSFNINQNQYDKDQFEENYVDDFYEYVQNKHRATMRSNKIYF